LTERIVKNGGRYYKKPDREKPPMLALMPASLKVLSTLFETNGDGPSVTTVLGTLAKPALIGWAAKEERKYVGAVAGELYKRLFTVVAEPVTPDKFTEMLNEELGKLANRQLLEQAASVGTQVHNRIEWNLKGELGLERAVAEPALTTDQAKRAFKRWEEWRITVKLKPIAMEKRIYSMLFGYGGTLDLLAEVELDGKVMLVVIDWKTGKAVYAEAYLQNVAYRMAIKEEGIDAPVGFIIRLPKYETDPEFDAVRVPDDQTSVLETTFLALLVVYKWWVNSHPKKSRAKPKEATSEPNAKG
jgi:hypothetical protein